MLLDAGKIEVVNRPQGTLIKGQLIAKIKDEYRSIFYKKNILKHLSKALTNKFGVQSIKKKVLLSNPWKSKK